MRVMRVLRGDQASTRSFGEVFEKMDDIPISLYEVNQCFIIIGLLLSRL